MKIRYRHNTCKLFIISLLITTLFSCNKREPGLYGMESGILRNYTGFDGCGWVIEMNSGDVLEPINLSDFPITLTDGKHISINYTIKPYGSICMVGYVVEINALKE